MVFVLRPCLGLLICLFSLSPWSACLHTELHARLACLEHRIARNHERIETMRIMQTKYFQELKQIREKASDPRPLIFKEDKVKNNLRSLADLSSDRFTSSHYLFKFNSKDDSYALTVHSLIEVDNDTFANSNGLTINNGIRSAPIIGQNTINRFWVNRARLAIEGNLFSYLNYFINADFGQSQQRVYDAFVSIHYWRSIGIKIGKQTSLVTGVENFVMASVYHTLQPGFTTILAPNRETGLVVYGSLGPYRPRAYNIWLSPFGFDDWLSYQLGFFGGTADGTNPGLNPFNLFEFNTQNASISNKAFEGRILMNPFIGYADSPLESLALVFSGSSQIVNNELLMPALVSPGANPIFVYQSNVAGNGPRNRIHPALFWHYQKFGVILDGTQTIQRISSILNADLETLPRELQPRVTQVNRAYQLQFSYNLTPERYSYLSLDPIRDFHFLEKGAIGAWQVTFQLSRLVMDPSVFQDYSISYDQAYQLFQKKYTYSDPRVSIQRASSFTLSLHWYWNKNFRLSTEYDQTFFSGGCSSGGLNSPINPGCLTAPTQYISAINSTVLNRPTEKLIMERVQLFF